MADKDVTKTNETVDEKPKAKRTAKAKAETDEVAQLKAANEQLTKALADMQEQIKALQTQAPQVITYSPDTERVQFQWEAPVSDETQVDFGTNGMYGRIVGKTGSFSVPKDELSRLLTAEVRMYLDKRWLIVVSGLDEQEREALGVDYKEGEVLDRKMFMKMVDMGERILEIYPNLCQEHKNIVGRFFYETWLKDPKRLQRDVVVKLYKVDKNIAFQKIIEGMNADELAE